MANFYILLAMMIWGSLGLVVKSIDLPAIEIAFVRALVGSAFLMLSRLVFVKEKINFKSKSLPLVATSGVALGANWLFLFKSYKYTSVINATLSYYMAPVFAVVFASVFLNEKISKKGLVSISMSVLGLTLIMMKQPATDVVYKSHILGIAFGLVAACLYAGVIVMNKLESDMTNFDKSLVQIFASLVVLLPLVSYRQELHVRDLNMLLLCLVIGVVHTGIPYLMYFSSLKKVSVQNAAVLSYADPMFAILLSSVFLMEPLGASHFAGGGLILMSTLLTSK